MQRDIEPRVIEAYLPANGGPGVIPQQQAPQAKGAGIDKEIRFEPELLA